MYPIKSDRRWTITREFCGERKPMFIVRFCGDWVDKRATFASAVLRAVGAKAARDGALIVTEVT